ncbi:MAG: NRDE family protein [Betaproteobacteria bacterium]|nr:NRDE family protein [Betaproteobacteria bacterium]
MCLILFAYRALPGVPLLIAANRDERFDRPALPAARWSDHPEIWAGRDVSGGGTWLGVSRRGRFAALTNFRDPQTHRADAPTRGGLVKNFLTGHMSARDYVEHIAREAVPYNGFCLLAWDGHALFFYSNRAPAPLEVAPGVHGLPNQLLNAPWPKVVKGRAGLQKLLQTPFAVEDHLALLSDTTPAPDSELPQRGRPLERERRSSPLRIVDARYGTRCSTVLRVSDEGAIDFAERTFLPSGEIADDVRYQLHTFSNAAASGVA